jgi:hypothetical protein
MSSANIAVLVLLWAVVISRAPVLRGTSWKRAPWLAFLALAIALTIDLNPVISAIDRVTGIADLAVLIKHLAVLGACAAVLDWVTTLPGPEHAPAWLRRRHLITAGAAAALIVLFTVMTRPETTQFTETESGWAAATYLWIFYAYLGTAMTLAAVLFAGAYQRCAPDPARPGLRAGLMLLAAGTGTAAVYAVSQAIALALRTAGLLTPAGDDAFQTVASILEDLAIVLTLAGTTLPALGSGWLSARDLRAVRALRPMWKDLSATAPLTGSPFPAQRGVTSRFRSAHLQLIRRTTEIRDSALRLSCYVPSRTLEQARGLLAARGLHGPDLDAAAEAAWLRLALFAAGGGSGPCDSEHVFPGGANLAEETAWLRRVAAAYTSPPVQETARHLADGLPAQAAFIPAPRRGEHDLAEGAAS